LANKKMQIDIHAKDKTKAGVASADKSVKGLSATVGKLGTLLAGLGAGLALVKIARDFVAINREFQRLNASLITVTGSTDAANAAFKNLEDFATRTPYQLTQVVDSFIKLKAMGLDPSNAALESYGNTASAMGKDLNMMIEAVADAATGEFERLKEFGIKAKSEGDNVTFLFRGVATTVKKEASAIEGYLRKLGDIEFAGGMARQMDTLGGAISNLQDSYDALFRKMGEDSGLSDQLTASIKGLSGAISDPNFIAALTSVASLLADIAKGTAESFTNVSASIRLASEWAKAREAGDIGALEFVQGQFGLIDRRKRLEEVGYDKTYNSGGVTFEAPPRPVVPETAKKAPAIAGSGGTSKATADPSIYTPLSFQGDYSLTDFQKKTTEDFSLISKGGRDVADSFSLAGTEISKYSLTTQTAVDELVPKIKEQTEVVKEQTEEMSEAWIKAQHNMQNAGADFFYNALQGNLNSFEGFVDALKKSMDRMVANWMAAQLQMEVSSKGSGVLGQLVQGVGAYFSGGASGLNSGTAWNSLGRGGVGGYRAEGGPVSVNTPYIVGEKGPELLMMGNTAGNVIPNSALGGSSPINIVQNLDLRGADDTTTPKLQAAGHQIALEAFNMVQQSMSRGGTLHKLSRG